MQHKSYFKEQAPETNYPRLQGTVETDIAIIGGGITGLTAAYLLQRAGRSTVVVEADRIGGGATGSSSCHLTTSIDLSFAQAVDRYGEERATMIADSRRAAIDLIASLAGEMLTDCHFRRLDGYYYAEEAQHVDHVEDEFKRSQQAGLSVSLTQEVPLPFAVHNAVIFHQQARFNSQAYLHGLAQLYEQVGGRIFEQSRISEVEQEERLISSAGGQIRYQQLIMATHLPLLIDVLQTLNYPYRSYIVTARVANPPADALYWDQHDPYFYTRLVEEDKILVGGADHKTGEQEAGHDYFQDIKDYIRARYEVISFDEEWSAQFYEPADGLPYIGESPFKDIYVATGYSGDGLVYGTLAGMLLSDQLGGRENAWADLYDARRFRPLKSGKNFVQENLDVAGHLIGDRFREDQGGLPARGEGKIMSVDGEKLAVATDDDGQTHYLSPVCPHLGCYVAWNTMEKTWDCPCHGSRFEADGQVICGPALNSLAKKGAQADK